ncbi:MAG: S-layer homology domain-containing protein [Clostridia bacterium]|nr:S-layer homology domain-containing protein [Clostridia bacterium]
MKKFIFGLLLLGLLALGIPAFAAVSEISAEFDATASILTVSGSSTDTLMVIVPKNSSTDIPYELEDIDEVSGKLLVFGEAKSENGTFSQTFPLPTDEPDGNYTVFVCSNDMEKPERVVFRYISEKTLNDALDEINDAGAEDIISIIDTYKELLGLDTSNLSATDAENIILVRPEDGFSDPDELQAGMDKGYALTVLNSSQNASEFKTNIESFKETLGLDLAVYSSIGTIDSRSEKQLAVCEDVLAKLPVTDLTAFCSELNSTAMRTDIKTAEDWAYLRDMVTETYREQLDISEAAWEKYEKLKDKAAVFKSLYNKKPDDIEDAFEDAVEAQYKSEKSSSSSSSSSGGSGGSSIKGSAVISTPIITEPENAFSDLDDAVWAESDITALKNAGILAGDGSGSFYPNRTVTREELVTMVVKAFGFEKSEDTAFEDVSPDAWYANNIAAAFSSGAISGISETKFGVGMAITRQDLATILFRCSGLNAIEEGKTFADEQEIDEYAKEAVSVLSSHGVISGMDENNFGPKQTATRAQVAVMLNRLLNLKEGNNDA